MKSLAASILLIALLAQISNRYMLMLNYEMNKDFIAKALCVNRDKPMSCCKGKCYLKKQLDKSAKEENAPSSNTRDDKNEVFFLSDPQKADTYLSAEQSGRQYTRNRQLFLFQNLYGSVFHPPRLGNPPFSNQFISC